MRENPSSQSEHALSISDDSLEATELDAERYFWELVGRGELSLQRCKSCDEWVSPPSFCCPNCLGRQLAWERVEGLGTVWSFTVYYHAFAPQLIERVPYNVVLVELSEGPLLMGNVEFDSPSLDQLEVGLPVRILTGSREGRPFYWFVPVDERTEKLIK